MSTDSASSHPAATRTSAASSPAPSCTDGSRARRTKKRSISSNSFTRSRWASRARRASLRRTSADLVAADRIGEAIEHAVHDLVAIGAAVRLRELHGLVDHDAIGNVETVHELPCPDHEDRAL